MNRGFGRALAAAVLMVAFGGFVLAADSPAPADSKALDKAILDSLRDVHNHGADLYNMGKDYSGAYRVYEGALRAVKPILGYRPATQKTIEEGLGLAVKEQDPARRAFLLHETIEKVRTDLKAVGAAPKTKPEEVKKPPEKKPEETKKPTEKMPEVTKKPVDKKPEETKKPTEPKPVDPIPSPTPKETVGKKTDGADVSGVISFEGKPLPVGEATFISIDQKSQKAITVPVKDGKYAAKGLPPGKYKVVIAGGKDSKLPAKFTTSDATPLTVEVKAGANTSDLDLK